MKRIGILGGTFNPVHKGHLALAAAAKEQFVLNEIVFVPSGRPPHKQPGEVVEGEHRFEMLRLAIKGFPKYFISRVELDREGYSYAIDTFTILRKEFGPRSKMFYIMGLDSINELLSWKKPLELFKLCEFIVGTRPGSRIRTFKRLVKFPPLQKEVDKIHLMEIREDISASEIRKRLKEGKPVKHWLTPAVFKYIKEHDLYQ
jgi:nicotinate-nucleotide adenylyltransferase